MDASVVIEPYRPIEYIGSAAVGAAPYRAELDRGEIGDEIAVQGRS